MQGHLRTLILLVALGSAPVGCDSKPAPLPTAAPTATVAPATTSTPGSFAGIARAAALEALDQVKAMRARITAEQALARRGGEARAAYLELRRAIASGAPYWRRTAATFVEPLLGPPRGADEAGGALLKLDRALEAGDRSTALAELAQVERALRVIHDGLGARKEEAHIALDVLVSTSFDAGLAALEAVPGIPDGHDAVLADLRGTLEVLERTLDALEAGAPSAAQSKLEPARAAVRALLDPVRSARSTLDLRERASFVRTTSRIGDAAIAFAEAIGAPRPKLPYESRDGRAPHALSLPRSPRAAPPPSDIVELGTRLFFDRRLSKHGVRACATCHDPARAFTDGLTRPDALDPSAPPLRHTPTLSYQPLSAVQMWDGRTLTPEAQVRDVIRSKAEMGLDDDELVAALRGPYGDAFARMPGGLTPENVARAIVAFETSALSPGRAPIDRFALGDDAALTADERAGLDVFAGKGRCARCHAPPSFGGSRPPEHTTPVFAAIGVPVSPAKLELDPDRGRGAVTGRPSDDHAFKTPTVRNVAKTAPYFHNGSFGRLEAVVDFYDKGGGRGLGYEVPNQDPEVRPLELTAEEKRVLLAFLKSALTDPSAAR